MHRKPSMKKTWTLGKGFALLIAGLLTATAATANDLYVSTNATHTFDGSSWTKAYTNLQDALDEAEYGDTIRLAGHVFEGAPDTGKFEVFRLANVTNLLVRGGYEALEDDPGQLPGTNNPTLWPTVLRRADGDARVMTLTSVSNVVIEQITFRDGWLESEFRGGGLYLDNCHDLVFDACNIVDNNLGGSGGVFGGGIYLTGSTVALYNSMVSTNIAWPSGGHSQARGGGVYVHGTSRLTVTNTVIRGNLTVSGGRRDTWGGGVFVASGGHLDIQNSILVNNVSDVNDTRESGHGGALANHGTAVLRNVLIAGNQAYPDNRGDGVFSSGANAKTVLVNCTVADNNNGRGLEYDSGVVFAITNTIVRGHTIDLHNFPTDGEGRLPDVWYSNIGDGQNAGVQGCSSVDPLFADTVHYHLQSTAGHYTNGYFSGGEWTTSDLTSALISRGDPASDFSNETGPNGGRINIGAYGNTSVAARTPDDNTEPDVTISNLSSGRSRAVIVGEILDGGGDMPETWIHYWQEGSPDTNIVWAGIQVQADAFTRQLSGLTPGATYQALIVASNRNYAVESGTVTFTQRSGPADLYVSTNGNNTAGDNWSNAYDIATAVWLLEEGDALYLAGHVYEAAQRHPLHGAVFEWSNWTNISLRGGYQAPEGLDPDDLPGPRDSDQWPTVLRRADGEARVMTLTSVSNVVFEQITFRDGQWTTGAANHGGGLYLDNCHDLVFDACNIVDNELGGSGGDQTLFGGGIYLFESTVALYNSEVSGNTNRGSGHSTRRGGGVYVHGTSRLTVTNTVIRGNLNVSGGRRYSWGGGVFVASGGHLDIQNSILVNNVSDVHDARESGHGGALANYGTAVLRNVLIAGNQVYPDNRGDGVFSSGANAKTVLVNCTVADNNNGRGLEYDSGVVFAITNTIVWGHTDDLYNFPTDGDGRLLNVSHSLFATPDTMDDVEGCKTSDPLFVDPPHDYRLQRGSPAIDAGINQPWMIGATDLGGLPRLMHRIVDMGCYESIPPRGTIIMLR